MEIKTNFKVNDLVLSKYQKQFDINKPTNKFLICMEVMQITTNTCMAGTQIFYDCRTMHVITATSFVDGKMTEKVLDLSPGSLRDGDYTRFREDELKPVSQEVVDFITEHCKG